MTATASPSCLCIDVQAAAQSLTKAYGLFITTSGITAIQFSQLHAIRTLGSANLNQLATETELDRNTLGRNIRLPTSMGLVDLRAAEDGRNKAHSKDHKGTQHLP
jgi:DNA-binding MarR family transcriptional regulator